MQNETNTAAQGTRGGGGTGARTENGSNLETLVVTGFCKGEFFGRIDREFSGNHVVMIKHDGTVLVHDTLKGVVPVCYLTKADKIELDRDMSGVELEVFAAAGKEKLSVSFSKVRSMYGLPSRGSAQLAKAILGCVSETQGRLGRYNVARILAGSSSPRILTMDQRRLASFGALASRGMKETIRAIDALIRKGYLEVADDPEYPTIALTAKGSEVLKSGDLGKIRLGRLFLPDRRAAFDDKQQELFGVLANWRDGRAKLDGVPPYHVLNRRSLAEIVLKRPRSREELEAVWGIGPAKSGKYGRELLDILRHGKELQSRLEVSKAVAY